MKILLVANGVVRAGVSRVLSLLSQNWGKEHDLSLAMFKAYDDQGFPVHANVVMQDIPFRGLLSSQVWHLYWLLKHNHFDRIYGFSEDANYPLILAAKLAGISHKVILTVHNPMQKLSVKVKKRIASNYKYADKVIAVSSGVRYGLVSLGLPDEKVVFCPNPINLEFIDKAMMQSPAFLLDSTCLNVVAMGRLHHHKGFDLLIEAFASVEHSFPNARLHILGDGPDKDSLQKIIDSHNLGQLIKLHGALENPFAILAQADLFVLSSRLEGWPLALMEAMATRLPVIAFECPNGPDEIIEDGLSGLLVKCSDVNALTRSICALLSDQVLRSQFGVAARSRIEAFEMSKVADRWLSV